MRFRLPEDRVELRRAAVCCLLLLFFAALPEAVGRLLSDPGTVPYIGGDQGVYFGYIEQVRQGHFLFTDLYTAEPQPVRFLNIFWLAVGLAARLTGASPDAAFFVSRIAFVPVVVAAALYAIRTFLPDPAARRVALPLALFGAGVGAWVMVGRGLAGLPPAGDALPVDLWVPEATVTLSALATAHFLASIAVIAVILGLAFRYWREPSWARLAAAAALMALLAQFHPYYVPLTCAVAAFGMLAQLPTGRRYWQCLGFATALAAAAIVGLLPFLAVSTSDLTTILRNATNQTPMLSWWAALAAGGAFLPLAAIAAWRGRRARLPTWRFLVVWVVVQLAFVVAPLPWQRKMTEALVLPLAMLAAPEIRRIWSLVTARLQGSVAALRPMLAATAMFLVFGASTAMQILIVSAPYVYPSVVTPTAADHAAIAWVRAHLPENAVIAATAERGNGIAAFSGRRVYAGHWSETINIDMKMTALAWIASTAAPEASRIRFLQREGVTHVYIGPLERGAWAWNPAAAGLRRVYDADGVAVYEVPPASATLP